MVPFPVPTFPVFRQGHRLPRNPPEGRIWRYGRVSGLEIKGDRRLRLDGLRSDSKKNVRVVEREHAD